MHVLLQLCITTWKFSCALSGLQEPLFVCVLLQLCITTWKLFEALLCKHDRHVAHNLVLRNLDRHSHVDLSLTKHHSPILHDVTITETNCVNSDDSITNTDADFANVTSTLSDSALEGADTQASGDGGLTGNSIHSLSSPSLSNAVVMTSQNGPSDVKDMSSFHRYDGSTLPAETETCMADTAAGGDSDKCQQAVGVDTEVHSHVMAEYYSAFKNQNAASLLPSHSSSSHSSTEIPIQQVVYM